jgi:hypothetical protein
MAKVMQNKATDRKIVENRYMESTKTVLSH